MFKRRKSAHKEFWSTTQSVEAYIHILPLSVVVIDGRSRFYAFFIWYPNLSNVRECRRRSFISIYFLFSFLRTNGI